MDPLRLAIHVVQNRRAGWQKSHREKTNKENYHFKLRMSLACLVPFHSINYVLSQYDFCSRGVAVLNNRGLLRKY